MPGRFGFHSIPFTREIRVADRFAHEAYERPREYLRRAVDKRMSAALIAPAGTGKTTLLRTLMGSLPESRYRVRYVKVTDLSKRDLCREIATSVGAEPAGNYPTLVRRLQERFTNDLDVDAVRPVLFLDDSHGMRPEVLGILRILTNFDMDSRLVLSFVLAGQPPLAQLLRDQRLVDVTHRLAHCATLRPLSRKETADYIEHRCRIAGAAAAPFDGSALPALYEIGRGNLRATDHLAPQALELAHDNQCDVVDAQHVTEARRLLWP
ncbi:MAG: AAA family ATPase [Hyphomicrobiales bacterium]|nr:AAA family ATPase [Hyphomicrobiales bacterium]